MFVGFLTTDRNGPFRIMHRNCANPGCSFSRNSGSTEGQTETLVSLWREQRGFAATHRCASTAHSQPHARIHTTQAILSNFRTHFHKKHERRVSKCSTVQFICRNKKLWRIVGAVEGSVGQKPPSSRGGRAPPGSCPPPPRSTVSLVLTRLCKQVLLIH